MHLVLNWGAGLSVSYNNRLSLRCNDFTNKVLCSEGTLNHEIDYKTYREIRDISDLHRTV